MKAIVVDKDYGSVTSEELARVAAAYAAAGIEVQLLEYQVSAAQQKEPTEDEIIAGCQGAQIILATGNPPITRAVMEALPELKFVQRFGAGVNSIDLEAAAELGVIVLNLPGFCAKELADVACVSQNYFSALFKKETGQNYKAYLTSIRMEEAIKLLRTTDLKTYEIGEKVGYNNVRRFVDAFKQLYNVSPMEYRKSLI